MPCCEQCFQDFISCTSTDPITFNTTVDAGTYFWVITDEKGNTYSFAADIVGGTPKLDTTKLPAGLLNPYIGVVQIELHKDMVNGEAVALQLYNPSDTAYTVKDYTCINLTVKDCADVEDKFKVGVEP